AAAKLSNTGPTLRRMTLGQPSMNPSGDPNLPQAADPQVRRRTRAAAGPERRASRAGWDHGSSDARGLHAAQLLLKFLDLVSEPRGDLELQFRGRGVHLLGELGNERYQIAAGFPTARRRAVGGPGAGG